MYIISLISYTYIIPITTKILKYSIARFQHWPIPSQKRLDLTGVSSHSYVILLATL